MTPAKAVVGSLTIKPAKIIPMQNEIPAKYASEIPIRKLIIA
jgi:hypothetical protein